MVGISAREGVIIGEYSTRLFKGNRMLPQVRGGLSWIPVEAHTVPRLLYLLMGIENRLFPVMDVFCAISGMPLACSPCLSLPLAKQPLDSSEAASGCHSVPRRAASRSTPDGASKKRAFAPRITRFLTPANTICRTAVAARNNRPASIRTPPTCRASGRRESAARRRT